MRTHEEVIRGVYRDLFNSGDVTLADQVVTADFVDHSAPPTPFESGPQQLAAAVGFLHTVFADLSYRIDDLVGSGDRVAYRATLTATQVGEIFGFPATGRRFEMSQLHMVRFEGDRIAEHWACRDDLGALRQLGHL